MGSIVDTSDFDLSFTGDSNVMDWNIGDTGSVTIQYMISQLQVTAIHGI